MRVILSAIIVISVAVVARAEPLRIMPIGDSITAGNDDSNLTPGGYRTTLYGLLNEARYDFDFVGRMQDNPGPMLDNDHEGHSGITLEQIRQSLGPVIVANEPDVILLLAGSNDVTWSLNITPDLTVEQIAGRLDALLNDFYVMRPNAIVFIGTLPMAAANKPLHVQRSGEVAALFPGVVDAQAALGHSVHLVDVRAVLTQADLSDSVHPSPVGYAKLGHAWFDAIASVIPPPAPPFLPGDVNSDGTVNIFDINVVSANWSNMGAPGIVGDANNDGTVNVFDINLVSANWTRAPDGQSSPVPEPSGVVLGSATLMACVSWHVARRISRRRG